MRLLISLGGERPVKSPQHAQLKRKYAMTSESLVTFKQLIWAYHQHVSFVIKQLVRVRFCLGTYNHTHLISDAESLGR